MIQLRYYNMYHWWKCVLNARVYVHVMVVRWRLCAIDMRCHCLHLNQWHSQLLGQAPHTLNCEKYEYSSNPMKMNRSKRNQKSQKKILNHKKKSLVQRFFDFFPSICNLYRTSKFTETDFMSVWLFRNVCSIQYSCCTHFIFLYHSLAYNSFCETKP